MNAHGAGVRIIATEAPLTRRMLQLCALLGMGICNRRAPATCNRPLPAAARDALTALPPGQHLYITGESGSGKSTLLTRIEQFIRERGDHCTCVDPASLRHHHAKAPIDLCDGPIEQVLATLACAGLAEGPMLVRPIRKLSDGQKWRLALAVALQHAAACLDGRRRFVLIDECAASLDSRTARGVCTAMGRWAAREGVCIIAAGCLSAPALWLGASGTIHTGKERAA